MAASTSLSLHPTPAATNTYLEFCQKEVESKPLIVGYAQASTVFSNRALIYAIAFPIITVAALAAAAAIAPIFMIVVGFSAFLLLFHVKKVYSELMLKSEIAQQRADQLYSIHTHYETLTNSTPAQIQQMLRDRGLSFVIGMGQNDPRLTQLKPLIARHIFWEERIQSLKTKQQEKLQQADVLIQKDFKLNRNEIYTLQSQALEFENQVLIAKVKCAFVNAVLFNPNFKGRFEDIGTFSLLSGQERAIALSSNTAEANDLFKFNRPNATAISCDKVKQCTIHQLAMQLYPNMHS